MAWARKLGAMESSFVQYPVQLTIGFAAMAQGLPLKGGDQRELGAIAPTWATWAGGPAPASILATFSGPGFRFSLV